MRLEGWRWWRRRLEFERIARRVSFFLGLRFRFVRWRSFPFQSRFRYLSIYLSILLLISSLHKYIDLCSVRWLVLLLHRFVDRSCSFSLSRRGASSPSYLSPFPCLDLPLHTPSLRSFSDIRTKQAGFSVIRLCSFSAAAAAAEIS